MSLPCGEANGRRCSLTPPASSSSIWATWAAGGLSPALMTSSKWAVHSAATRKSATCSAMPASTQEAPSVSPRMIVSPSKRAGAI